MNERNQCMLFFSLGPVQPFIEQARKTRDLWIGSKLLSEFMEVAISNINDDQLVYPEKRKTNDKQAIGDTDASNIPNKYIAIFDDPVQARAVVERSKEQIAKYWQDKCNIVWREVINNYGDGETRRIWQRQTGVDPKDNQAPINLDSLFEIYWVIIMRNGLDYGKWYEKTEQTLAARKRLRDFQAVNEPGEKSSISGVHEVLHRKEASFSDLQNFWKQVATRHSPKDINKDGKERLDALDTVKRFAMKAGAISETPFPSTSSIATASFVEGLLGIAPGLPEAILKKWRQVTIALAQENTRDIPYLKAKVSEPLDTQYEWLLQRDGDLYFPETFVTRRMEQNYGMTPATKAESLAKEGNKALKDLLQITDAHGIPRPTPYYAVMQMDGDRMGMVLSGVEEEIKHKKISRALSHFSHETAANFIEKQYPARLVYAGGDDVLAFAPLVRSKNEQNEKAPQHVFELLQGLQEAYCQEVREAISQRNMPDISASAGVVIAHHYTPLSYVLRTVRESEKTAKRHYSRNALVVTLIRHSGEQTRVGCHWYYRNLANEGQPIRLFSKFYELFRNDVLSRKCVYTLLEEAPALIAMEHERITIANAATSAMQSEIKRVLKRQRDSAKKDAFPDETVETYAGHLARLAVAMDFPRDDKEPLALELHEENRRRYGLVEVLGWLLVMAFLARKGEE